MSIIRKEIERIFESEIEYLESKNFTVDVKPNLYEQVLHIEGKLYQMKNEYRLKWNKAQNDNDEEAKSKLYEEATTFCQSMHKGIDELVEKYNIVL